MSDERTNEQILNAAGAYCGECDYETGPWSPENPDGCSQCADTLRSYVAALAAAGRLRDTTPTGDTAALVADLRKLAALDEVIPDGSLRRYGTHPTLSAAADALEASEAARANLEARMPKCDGGCNYNDGPDETCSRDGRPVAEVWKIAEGSIEHANRAEGEAEVLRERVANLEAVITEARSIPRGIITERRNGYSVENYSRRLVDAGELDAVLDKAGDPVVLREHAANVLRDAAETLDDYHASPTLRTLADRVARGEGS